jgi:predicted nucleic acid-binding protein
MKAVLDTNVIFAFLYEKDPFHEKSVRIIENVGKVILPLIVVFELTYLFYKYNINLKILENLISADEVEVVGNLSEDILYALAMNPKSYDEFNDYIILSTARRLKSNLITFDKELEEIFNRRG